MKKDCKFYKNSNYSRGCKALNNLVCQKEICRFYKIKDELKGAEMLVKIDYKNNNESEYLCDRCKKRIKANERYVINVHITKLNIRKKKYDLCEKCYKSLERGVRNARNKIQS